MTVVAVCLYAALHDGAAEPGNTPQPGQAGGDPARLQCRAAACSDKL